MSEEIDYTAMDRTELERFARVLEQLSDDRDRLLAAIPECPHHGPCIPYALAWLERARQQVPALAPDEIPGPVFTVESLRALVHAAIEGRLSAY